jgi:hypothetical protein
MVETLAELPFIGDQVVCLSHDPSRPQRNAIFMRLVPAALTDGVAEIQQIIERWAGR